MNLFPETMLQQCLSVKKLVCSPIFNSCSTILMRISAYSTNSASNPDEFSFGGLRISTLVNAAEKSQKEVLKKKTAEQEKQKRLSLKSKPKNALNQGRSNYPNKTSQNQVRLPHRRPTSTTFGAGKDNTLSTTKVATLTAFPNTHLKLDIWGTEDEATKNESISNLAKEFYERKNMHKQVHDEFLRQKPRSKLRKSTLSINHPFSNLRNRQRTRNGDEEERIFVTQNMLAPYRIPSLNREILRHNSLWTPATPLGQIHMIEALQRLEAMNTSVSPSASAKRPIKAS
ncbi:hypothetical protein SJAG_01627 [Schizosaccharomyces japonicus yFS275]|uniref:Uncharacterized protein n=1 Tax=Schizosaccharomyces japonicus (strain yFS275 / FY16936) TaxID=402676 RepID=B6JYG5_SCHJY|nr:hypothetical protein SJAG_01627 [Schizosaccharomyces japonicus yFS275]EEB06583.1 hypothetical protein SJAG_01627 [Schizosaccharomyces japonicus yFS275]